MINASEPGRAVRSNELLNELISTLTQMESKLMNVIPTLENEDDMSFALKINDDVQSTLRRYRELEKGHRPKPFASTSEASQ